MKNLNIADLLSLYRILSAPIMILLMIMGEKNIFAWLLLVSFTTDVLDGIIARALKITSSRGAMLDSVGDLVTVVVGIAGLIRFEREFLSEQYKLIAIALGLYFLCIFFSFIRYGKMSSFHTYLAKISAVLFGVFLVSLFIWRFNYPLFLITIIVSALDSLEEICMIILIPYWRTNVKGIYWLLRERGLSEKGNHSYKNISGKRT